MHKIQNCLHVLQCNHRFRSLLSSWAATPLQSFPLSPLFIRHRHAQNPTQLHLQIRVRFLYFYIFFIEKFECFCFVFSHRPQRGKAIWQYAEELETENPLCWAQICTLTLWQEHLFPHWVWHEHLFPRCRFVPWQEHLFPHWRFVPWQEHLFPHCFGTFSFSSFSFHFALSEKNLKIILTWLPEKQSMLVFCSKIQASLSFVWKIQCWDYTKHNTEADTMSARGSETCTCAIQTLKRGIFWTGKQTNCKTCPKIFIMIFS